MTRTKLIPEKVGTPATVLEDLNAALTIGIEELTRPIDAIKRQAKSPITVGISRSDEEIIQLNLVTNMLESGTPRDRISYKNLRYLAAMDRPLNLSQDLLDMRLRVTFKQVLPKSMLIRVGSPTI